MAESAKILNPQKKVLLPAPAGPSMAMIKGVLLFFGADWDGISFFFGFGEMLQKIPLVFIDDRFSEMGEVFDQFIQRFEDIFFELAKVSQPVSVSSVEAF
jgi:hypothetical protein